MFAVRGIAISCSIFVVLYGVLSAAVCGLWRRMRLHLEQRPARRNADLLFALRLSPFLVALGITLGFAVPSFLLLEPRSGDEPMGIAAWLLGGGGIAVLLAGIGQASAALLRASRTVARWSSQAEAGGSIPVDSIVSVSVRRISADAPPLTATGILRPSVWLSSSAERVLTESELQSALRHEIAHIRRRDNLRKLILRFVSFPGMVELESAWREASEMAADDAAVSSASEALDLAEAVIKLSRLAPLQPPAELTTALVHSPAESINARVERLIAWADRRQDPAKEYSLAYALCAAAAVAATLAVTYSELLVRVHAATEWLVR
jgi:Zn-dependent protease with chaperone function